MLKHVGLTLPYLFLLLAPLDNESVLKSVPIMAIAKCTPIAALVVNTFSKNQTLAVGLALSLIGDAFLAVSHQEYFTHGLGAFLLAHIAYIKAIQQHKPPLAPWAFIGFSCIAAVVTSTVLLPSIPRALKIPVSIYSATLVMMAWRSFARYVQAQKSAAAQRKINSAAPHPGYTQAQFGLIGSLLFVASDFLLAYNKFVSPIPRAQIWIIVTYYMAQIAIAKSV